MRPLRSLVQGTLDEEARAAARAQLDSPERDAALDDAFTLPAAPDVFDAAFKTAHPTPSRALWWALAALVTAGVSIGVWRLTPVEDTRLKAGGEPPAPEVTLLVLVAEGPQVRRAVPGESLPPEARLLFRATSSADGYVALELRRGAAWTREWPTAPGGATMKGGEFELGDREGAVAVRVGEGPLEVRLVTAAQPLDRATDVTTSAAQAFPGRR